MKVSAFVMSQERRSACTTEVASTATMTSTRVCFSSETWVSASILHLRGYLADPSLRARSGLVVDERGEVRTVQFDGREYACGEREGMKALTEAVDRAGARCWLAEMLECLAAHALS